MLLLVAAGEVFGMALWFSATAAAPAIAAEFGLDSAMRAWLTMAVQAGFVAGTLVTALTSLADAINARRLFALGCVAGAVTNAAIAVAPGGSTIVALRFLTGAALAWVYPPGMKIVAGWFVERRGTALGIVVGAVTIGSALPHLLNWLGAGLPWRVLVCSSSVLALAGAAIVGRFTADGPYVSASAPFDRHALRLVLASRGTRLAMLGYLGHMWELYAMWTWIAAFVAASSAARGLASSAAGSAVAFVTIASGAIGCAIAGWWADDWGKARIARWSMFASAACAALSPFFFAVPMPVLLVLAVVWG
ncbi:MAG TPA: MFS transporter, partial [Vicinamibacterales bacterium]